MRLLTFTLSLFISLSVFAQNQCIDIFTKASLTVEHGIIDHYSDKEKFGVEASSQSYTYLFEGILTAAGQLEIIARLAYPKSGVRSHLSGHVLYKQMIEHFGIDNIKSISGHWLEGTNHSQYFEARNRGLSAEEAALSTWSGRQAALYGFSKVASVQESANAAFEDPIVKVVFVRP